MSMIKFFFKNRPKVKVKVTRSIFYVQRERSCLVTLGTHDYIIEDEVPRVARNVVLIKITRV